MVHWFVGLARSIWRICFSRRSLVHGLQRPVIRYVICLYRYTWKMVVIDVVCTCVRLHKEALKQAAVDPSTGKIDVSILTTGISGAVRKQRADRAQVLLELIKTKGKVLVLNFLSRPKSAGAQVQQAVWGVSWEGHWERRTGWLPDVWFPALLMCFILTVCIVSSLRCVGPRRWVRSSSAKRKVLAKCLDKSLSWSVKVWLKSELRLYFSQTLVLAVNCVVIVDSII